MALTWIFILTKDLLGWWVNKCVYGVEGQQMLCKSLNVCGEGFIKIAST